MTAVTPAAPVTFTVDPWDPGYGLAFSEDLDGGALGESSAELNLNLELPAAEWHPIDPNPVPRLPCTVLFLDGVRRIDARIWVHGSNPQPGPGIGASFAGLPLTELNVLALATALRRSTDGEADHHEAPSLPAERCSSFDL